MGISSLWFQAVFKICSEIGKVDSVCSSSEPCREMGWAWLYESWHQWTPSCVIHPGAPNTAEITEGRGHGRSQCSGTQRSILSFYTFKSITQKLEVVAHTSEISFFISCSPCRLFYISIAMWHMQHSIAQLNWHPFVPLLVVQ